MAGRINEHGTFWTAYRQLYVRNALARGDSRSAIAERLGVTTKALAQAIFAHGLKPERLLGPYLKDRANG